MAGSNASFLDPQILLPRRFRYVASAPQVELASGCKYESEARAELDSTYLVDL